MDADSGLVPGLRLRLRLRICTQDTGYMQFAGISGLQAHARGLASRQPDRRAMGHGQIG